MSEQLVWDVFWGLVAFAALLFVVWQLLSVARSVRR